MSNEKRMEITIKRVYFRGTAGQFERAMGQVMQMVGGQGYLPQLQAPAPESSTVPVLPPVSAPLTPQPMLPMTVTAEGYELSQRFQAFQAVYNEFKPSAWIEIGYVTDSQKRIFDELLAVFGREDAALTCLRNALKAVSVDPHWQCRITLEEFAAGNRLFYYHKRWLDRLTEQHQLQPFSEPSAQLRLTEVTQQETTDDLARQLFELVKLHSQAAQSPRDNRTLDDTPLTDQPAIDVDSLIRNPAATPNQAATVRQAATVIDVDALIRQPKNTIYQATKLRRRRRLRRKVLLWLAEAIASLSLAVGAWFFFQNAKWQPTPVASPTPSLLPQGKPGATRKPLHPALLPAPKASRPRPIRPPSEPPPLSRI